MTWYDKHKFKRIVKQNKPDDTLTETPPTSEKTISARNFPEKCFFCDKLETCDTLDSFQTLYMDNCMSKIVHKLADTKVLVKLNKGDMVPTEAKYHRKFLVHFYKGYHNHIIRKLEETTNLEVIQCKFYYCVVRINR